MASRFIPKMEKKLQKLKDVDWKTKGGKVLKETALISEAVAEWVPGAGLIKYAANKGAEEKRVLEQQTRCDIAVTT